jgi:hypothetical protein
MCFPFFCVCVCVCVWITLGVYSVKNRPKKRKNEMGGFVFHSFVEFVLSCIPFFFLLVSGPSREGCQFTCLSLRRVALLWSCHITC